MKTNIYFFLRIDSSTENYFVKVEFILFYFRSHQKTSPEKSFHLFLFPIYIYKKIDIVAKRLYIYIYIMHGIEVYVVVIHKFFFLYKSQERVTR